VAIRVVVVDDEPMVCAHLRTILGSADDLEVVGEAHTAIERINQRPDAPVVVALTTFDADQYVLRALRLVAASADRQSTRQRARELVESLTERELEVLACLGEGLSNAQIAKRLYLSEATVKGYVSRMLDKLGCANRTQAGLRAHDAGLVGQ
jgi:DNA-binding NarL/FixJ family response regulator